MHVYAYLIVEPGGDRPYFCHNYPAEYLRSAHVKPGTRVFSFRLDVPGFEKVEGVIQLVPTDIVELTERTLADDRVEESEFTCPKCGSHMFGSARISNGTLERMCHGPDCRFLFPSTDDHLYFKGTSHFMPRTMTAQGPVLGDP